MIYLFVWLTITILELTVKFFLLPFKLLGMIISPDSPNHTKKTHKPYTLEEMFFYDELF